MSKPSITIVSGTYQRLMLLQQMVKSARAALPRGIPLDFMLVDGGSTDGTIEWCKAQPDVTLIEHGKLLGAVRAFTDGAKVATGKYVVMSNDDVAFFPNSLLLALVHLETHPHCGAVAFEDNRPVPPWYPDNTHYHVLRAPAIKDNKPWMAIYAQVGMFRRWLGAKVGWWGGDDPQFHARTYGADNYLSSKLWELGYSVERVDGCRVEDEVAEGELREINREIGGEADSQSYYALWTDAEGKHIGPTIPAHPQIEQQDARHLRILYLPIYEQGNDDGARAQHEQKCGLREALASVGWVYELDYMAVPERELRPRMLDILDKFKPDILFTQLHGPAPVTAPMLHEFRAQRPGMLIINWNGDTHRSHLTSPEMLALLHNVDLQLCVNVSVLPVYEEHGIPAAYWQIAYEPVSGKADAPAYDVVFLGSAYNENRKRMGRMLREMLDGRLGLYGDYWQDAQGRTLYDFEFSNALNRNAKLAIGSNEFPDDYGFVSNRVFETMAAGGCLFLMQHVPGLEELTGITPGIHFVEWSDLDDLRAKVQYYLDPAHEKERKRIAKAGMQFVREHHNFDARVRELFVGKDGKPPLIDLAKRRVQRLTGLRYKGMMTSQFGAIGPATATHYLCEPADILYVDARDVELMLRDGLWERADVFNRESV